MITSLAGQFPKKEYVLSGHNACPGCGAALAGRHLLKEIGSKAVMVIPPSCWGVISGTHSMRCLETAVLHCTLPSSASVARGLKRGLIAVGDSKTQVVVFAGDGGTFDIGLQGLSAAAEQNEDILFVCYDNEAYMNTGMQRSSASPYGTISTITPAPKIKTSPKKDIMKVMAAHQIPYAATANIAFPEDMHSKSRRALNTKGFRFLHILTPCPSGWSSAAEKTVEIARLAVTSCLFPLYEVENGAKYILNHEPEEFVPVEKYLKLQKRFSFLTAEQIETIQKKINSQWQELLKKAE